MAILRWSPLIVKRRTLEQVELGMHYAMQFMVATVAESLSVGYPPASLPGEPPALRTGTLRASIGSEVEVPNPNTVIGRYGVRRGPAEKYGRALELGYVGAVFVMGYEGRSVLGNSYSVGSHVRMMNLEARPFLRPALAENRREVVEMLVNGFWWRT